MTAQTDILYLPILAPARVQVRDHSLLSQERRPALQQWQHRIYRVPPRPRSDGISYGPDALMAVETLNGHTIDLFA